MELKSVINNITKEMPSIGAMSQPVSAMASNSNSFKDYVERQSDPSLFSTAESSNQDYNTSYGG